MNMETYTVQPGDEKACSACLEDSKPGDNLVVIDGWLYHKEHATEGPDVSVIFAEEK